MKDSIPSRNAHDGINCGFIQAAHRRVEEMRGWKPESLPPPTASELAEALGEEVQACALWVENWRNRVYRIELAGGGAALAKQVVMTTDAMLQYQYDQLRTLAALEIPGLRIPRALALLRTKRAFVMEFAQGRPIPPTLVWNRATASTVVPACELAGKILAGIHLARTERIGPIPIEALARDLNAAPWRLSSREAKVLQLALERLNGTEVRLGEVYYDYKAANLLFENGHLFLVDPPDVFRQGVLLWDFSCFRSSMRRHLWRFSLRRPFAGRRALIREGAIAFERGYLASLSEPPLESALFAAAIWLFELQRTALLMTMQEGKVSLARQKMPIACDAPLGNPLANRLTLPLLDLEKRWLFSQLARELAQPG